MTVHVPLVHPLYAAKALATVDHISHGRAGLNIVCGWNPKEFGMFGTPLVEKGYDQAAEWLDILERLYAADEPFDHDGTYYRMKEAVSRPASLQAPRPVTMNAAFGDPGRDFRRGQVRLPVHHLLRDSTMPAGMSPTSAPGPPPMAARSAATRWRMWCAGPPMPKRRLLRPLCGDDGRPRGGRRSHGGQEGVLAVARPARLRRLPPALRRRGRHLPADRLAGDDRRDDDGDRRQGLSRGSRCPS